MKYYSRSPEKELQGKGSTLIIPAWTIAQTGPFACDILLTNFQHRFIGYLISTYVIPCVGSNPFQDPDKPLTLPLEIYEIINQDLTTAGSGTLYVLQQRSPVIAGLNSNFASDLVKWIAEAAFEKVLILASIPSSVRKDAQIVGPQINYKIIGTLWKEQISSFQEIEPLAEEILFDKVEKITRVSPWSIITRLQESGIDCLTLFAFVTEGNNLIESCNLLSSAIKLLGLECDQASNSGSNEIEINYLNFKFPSYMKNML